MRSPSLIWGNFKLPLFNDAPNDGKEYVRKNKTWSEASLENYKWNIHSPEQVIDILDVPSGFLVDVDGAGGVLQALASGDVKVTAINENGETTPADVGAFNVLTDSTYALITWDEVDGATGYRVYYDGNYQEVLIAEIDYLLFSGSAGTPPTENTAVIYQSAFQIDKDDTVQYTGEGVDIETSVDLLDSTKKIVNIVKQQSDWNETDENSPNYIANKPTIPAEDNAIKVAIDFVDAENLEFVYNCPVALKFTSQESEGADAAISPALNTDMAQYGKVTITAAEVGLIVLNGVTL